MEDTIRVLREFGFPAAVAIFVLWRLDRTLHQILGALGALGAKIDLLSDLIWKRPPS